ncbi:hypothetical protein RND71_014902 [Anisodus tanguticus]|uniref:Uncharacterized protein n=1 Tax=Anisodus tanguticus TaxID=243964 RepID=A0AAE1SCI8_9SOLA|nr:hypothetical protein RND71_014902 [Anisodus tanguticus]
MEKLSCKSTIERFGGSMSTSDYTTFIAHIPRCHYLAECNPSISAITWLLKAISWLVDGKFTILKTIAQQHDGHNWMNDQINFELPKAWKGWSYSIRQGPTDLRILTANILSYSGVIEMGDNASNEWFVVFLLFETSKHFPNLSIQVNDSDGEFLLIETAFHLPNWVNPETSTNRVFIRGGSLHIIPKSLVPDTPSIHESLILLSRPDINCVKTRAPEGVQRQLENRLKEYPNRAEKNVHKVRVRVPVSVAKVLKHEPCLISLAVEGFYDRDIDTMKFAAKMERFLGNGGSGEELVQVVVRMSRAMYAQLVQQTFQAPKCYPALPPRSDVGAYMEAELGMKIACGFEMIYQLKKRQGMEGKGSTSDAFRQSLERSGYFEGLLPGSKEYKRLMQNAEVYYKNSSLHARESAMLSAPVRRIDEILALPESADDFKDQELPPSDDDSWLYGGDEELNAALQERQNEMELYNSKRNRNQKSRMGTAMNNSVKDVDFDVDRFMKDMESFVRRVHSGQGICRRKNRRKKIPCVSWQWDMKDTFRIMPLSFGLVSTGVEEDLQDDIRFDHRTKRLSIICANLLSLIITYKTGLMPLKKEPFIFILSGLDRMEQERREITLCRYVENAAGPVATGLDKMEEVGCFDEGGSQHHYRPRIGLQPFEGQDDHSLVDSLLDKNVLNVYSKLQGEDGDASNEMGSVTLHVWESGSTSTH